MECVKNLFKRKILIIFWLADIIWTVFGHYLLVVYPEGNILLKDLMMAVGYSGFRMLLFIYSGAYIINYLFYREKKFIHRLKDVCLPIVCYIGDAIILTIIYNVIS